MKRLVIELKDDAMYKEVRIAALRQDQTVRDYVINLIKKDLEIKKRAVTLSLATDVIALEQGNRVSLCL